MQAARTSDATRVLRRGPQQPGALCARTVRRTAGGEATANLCVGARMARSSAVCGCMQRVGACSRCTTPALECVWHARSQHLRWVQGRVARVPCGLLDAQRANPFGSARVCMQTALRVCMPSATGTTARLGGSCMAWATLVRVHAACRCGWQCMACCAARCGAVRWERKGSSGGVAAHEPQPPAAAMQRRPGPAGCCLLRLQTAANVLCLRTTHKQQQQHTRRVWLDEKHSSAC
jgi:hypothetical protein